MHFKHLESLHRRFEEGLKSRLALNHRSRRGGRAFCRRPATSPFPGLDAQILLMALDMSGVACSVGSACSSGSTELSPTLRAMGLPSEIVASSLRFSFGLNHPQNRNRRSNRQNRPRLSRNKNVNETLKFTPGTPSGSEAGESTGVFLRRFFIAERFPQTPHRRPPILISVHRDPTDNTARRNDYAAYGVSPPDANAQWLRSRDRCSRWPATALRRVIAPTNSKTSLGPD